MNQKIMDTNSTGLSIDQNQKTGVWHFIKYVGKLLARDRAGTIGLIMFIIVVLSALFAPWLSPHDPLKQNLRFAKTPPAWSEAGSIKYPLGTDNLGRDILSRIIYGSREIGRASCRERVCLYV